MLRNIKLLALKKGSPPFSNIGNFVICEESDEETNEYWNHENNILVRYKGADSPSKWVIEHPSEHFSIFIAGKVDFVGETPEGIYKDVGGVDDYIEVSFVTTQPATHKKWSSFFNSYRGKK